MMVMAKNEQKTARLNFQEGQDGHKTRNFKKDTAADANLRLNSTPLKYHHA